MELEKPLAYIERIASLMSSEKRKAAVRHGLQSAQADALLYLGHCNRYSNTPLGVAGYLGLTKGTVSQSVMRLVEKGLLYKVKDQVDRRVTRLHLTPGGKEVLESLTKALRRFTLAEYRSKGLERELNSLLEYYQEQNNHLSFGQCLTCTYFTRLDDGGGKCGLTGEALTISDTMRLCRDHKRGR